GRGAAQREQRERGESGRAAAPSAAERGDPTNGRPRLRHAMRLHGRSMVALLGPSQSVQGSTLHVGRA
ncbi:hypothetical protein, partial [Sorangium cellulosum]|uniref:hypothetical protein n=1 Tax=Sorangium cellulosum TaxID=56 RepID=UPI001F25E127